MNVLDRLIHQPDLGLLLSRLMLGAVGVFHGAQKLFGAFGGGGLEGFSGFLRSLDVPLPSLSALLAALAEFLGGILIALGLFTRVSALAFGFTMLVAIVLVHPGAFSAANNGMEFPLTLLVLSLTLFLAGPGRFTVARFVTRKAPASAWA